MSRAWRRYTKFVEQYPWGSQIVQTGVICATGDAVAQIIVERKSLKAFDLMRTARFFLMGSCVSAPCVRTLYLVMERCVKSKGAKGAVTKVIIDQALFAPCFLAFFVTIISSLQGLTFGDIKKKLRASYVDILLTNWKIWPGAQLLNFYFVPLQHRLLVANIVALFWNTYLAAKTNRKVS